jgi:hypothetical protein
MRILARISTGLTTAILLMGLTMTGTPSAQAAPLPPNMGASVSACVPCAAVVAGVVAACVKYPRVCQQVVNQTRYNPNAGKPGNVSTARHAAEQAAPHVQRHIQQTQQNHQRVRNQYNQVMRDPVPVRHFIRRR